MSCERMQDRMVEALYGELDAARAAEFEAHVAACAACATLYGEMRDTAARVSQRERPDPGDAYFDAFYDRLRARMDAAPAAVDASRVTGRRRAYVSWGYRVAAAVAVLAAGVWLGRGTLRPDPAPETASPLVAVGGEEPRALPDSTAGGDGVAPAPREVAREAPARDGRRAIDGGAGDRPAAQPRAAEAGVRLASADARALQYVERSQMLLLAVVNADPDSAAEGPGFGAQRGRARELVREASLIRDDLSASDDRRLRELVGQLQMILREIANMEADSDLDAVEIIRNRVDREGVLMQINVEQMRGVRAAGPGTGPDGAID